MYVMKEEFKTGIDFIDEQHQALFDIANKTYYLLKDEFSIDKYDTIVSLIEELREYSIYHFRAEEEYMEKIKYKRLFSQKVEHDNFIRKFDELDLNLIDENQDEQISYILDFLNNWLCDHIIHNDKFIGK